MFTGSSSTQLCPQQLDDILGPDLDQFEILICQLFSSDEDQVSRSKALFHLALRSRPDSLLLALSKLLSPGPPSLRAAAAKQIGEIFTTFSSNFLSTTLDTLKSDLLSAFLNEASNSDVWNPLLRTISDFHATGSWPELLPYLFECVDSHYLQKHALLVFKSLAINSIGRATLIPHLETFQHIFSKCLGNCSSWDVKIAALDTSISFVKFIPNQNNPNRFDYLLRLMMLALTEALNSESESETEDSLHLLIKLAKTNPWFFERQLEKVLRLMLKITVDDGTEVNIKHLAIEFLMALVAKARSKIRKEPQFIKRYFEELMYMLFDIEFVEANAADFADAAAVGVAARAMSVAFDDLVITSRDAVSAAAAAAAAVAGAAAARDVIAVAAASCAARVAADNAAAAVAAARTAVTSFASAIAAADNDEDGDGDGDEVDHIWEGSNCILGKKCLSKLSTLLDEKMIFQWVLRLFSHLLATSIWQQRHAVLIAIPKIAEGCNKAMLENLEEVVTKLLKSLDDSHPCVRLAAINAIRQLSVHLRLELQTQYHEIILIALVKVMHDSQRPKLQAAATTAALIFLTNGTQEIIDLYKRRIIDEFCKLTKVALFIKGNFLRSELVEVLSILSRDIDGRWTKELHKEYSSLIRRLKPRKKVLAKRCRPRGV